MLDSAVWLLLLVPLLELLKLLELLLELLELLLALLVLLGESKLEILESCISASKSDPFRILFASLNVP
jgi:hypothetical protein